MDMILATDDYHRFGNTTKFIKYIHQEPLLSGDAEALCQTVSNLTINENAKWFQIILYNTK